MVSKDSTKSKEPAAPEVTDVNESVVDGRTGAPGYVDEPALAAAQVIQRRTSTVDGGPEWPADGRYRKVFSVVIPRVSTGQAPRLDWEAPEHEAMHEANKVAVLQEALLRGLHPREEAVFDGQLGALDPASYGSASLVYSVPVVPAAEDGETAAATVTPSSAIAAQGGTTLPEDGGKRK